MASIHVMDGVLNDAFSHIEEMAKRTGVDWVGLLRNFPAENYPLYGSRLPVLSQKDKGRCFFVWHTISFDNIEGPLLIFKTFRHGGEVIKFNGLSWYFDNRHRIHTQQQTLRNKLVKVKECRKSPHDESDYKYAVFKRWLNVFNRSLKLTKINAWLAQKLKQEDFAVADRLSLKQVATTQGDCIMFAFGKQNAQGCVEIMGFQQQFYKASSQSSFKKYLVKQLGGKKGSHATLQGDIKYLTMICEGLTTGLALATVWSGPIVIALDAGNLAPVRQQIDKPCIIAADNDQFGECNVGLKAAVAAAMPSDCIIFPEFFLEELAHQPTDFHDYYRLYGKAALNQLVFDQLVGFGFNTFIDKGALKPKRFRHF